MTDVTGPMRGSKWVRETIALFFRDNLPAYIEQYNDEHQLSLPHPSKYLDHVPQGLDNASTPLIAAAVATVTSVNRDWHDQSADHITYTTTYESSVYVWVKAETWSGTMDLRDDLSVVSRIMLLDNPTLGNDRIKIQENTMAEAYSDIQPVKGDRHIAASALGFDMEVTEHINREGAGTVASTVVHPALLEG